jgi:ATP-dependent phosphoenolpyruvate carboxykinase
MSNVPSEILNPRNTWENPELYDEKLTCSKIHNKIL